jgi:hypothetical protein
VSAYVAEALADKAERENLADFLADWRGQVGPPSHDDTEWAEQVLGLGEKPTR